MPCKAFVKQAPLLVSLLFPVLLGAGLAGCERHEVRAEVPSEPTTRADVQQAPGIAPLSSNARSEYEQNSIDVFKSLAPSVVFVTNKQLRRDMWTRRTTEVTAGAGTGFIWDKRGHIVTNYHVVNQGNSFEVNLYDGTTLPAKFIGGDPKKDIAVLKISPKKNIRPVTLPSANSEVEVGQKAVAIGNPFGFDHTLTVGVISATGRERVGFGGVTIRDMLQTDASINPGNSGGPLLDSQGRLIGMNTMIASKSGGSAGIGFAVPVSAIRKVVPDVIRYGKVKRAGLGVDLISDEVARANGVDGVVIAKVRRGTPAAKAGLRGLKERRGEVTLGDIIVAIDSFPAKNYDQLYNALDRYKAGDTVDVTVLRGSKKMKVSLKLMQLE
jgi:S1-C subfamily serine protease